MSGRPPQQEISVSSEPEPHAEDPLSRSAVARFFRFFLRADGHRLRLRVGRTATATLVLLGSAYVGLATGVFIFVRHHQKIQGARFFDLLVPTRWPRYREARGVHEFELARQAQQSGDYPGASHHYRIGLISAPANRDARLEFARLLSTVGARESARDALLSGLPFHRQDAGFMRPMFACLLQQQEDNRIVSLCRELLPPKPAGTELDRAVALAAAHASFFRGNFDQAEDFLQLGRLETARDGQLLQAKIDWDRGYRDLALLSLRHLANAHPNDGEITAELADRLAKSGQRDEARRRIVAFQVSHPDLPGPRVALLRACHADHDAAGLARETDAFFRDFPRDSAALLALGEFAANTGDSALAERVLAHCRTRHLPTEVASFFSIEALIVAHDYSHALSSARTLLAAHPAWTQSYAPLIGSLEAVARFGLGDSENGRLLVENVLGKSYLRAEHLVAAADRLLNVGADSSALRLLTRALEADPLNQVALTRLIELELDRNLTSALPAHLRQLLTMRRPSPDVLRVAEHKLGSDLLLFAADRVPTLEAIRVALDTSAPLRRPH